MRAYYELPPPNNLHEVVECNWVSVEAHGDRAPHRVLPDGCADIIFRAADGQPELLAVGPMTRFSDIVASAGSTTFGIRLRPGMWSRVFRVQAHELTDCVIALEEMWGSTAHGLLERLVNQRTDAERTAVLSEAVIPPGIRTPVQRAIASLEARHGLVSMEGLAREAGVSSRQFRRDCMSQTGLSPKLLARILRFRHASQHAGAQKGAHAALAAECGYADQAHMISEFRRFSGRTPVSLS